MTKKKAEAPAKSSEKTYVKKKKLDIEYQNPEYATKDLNLDYGLNAIIARVNQYHKFKTPTANWVLSELQKRKSKLSPKAIQILNTPGLSQEATLRLLNLKNTVVSDSPDSVRPGNPRPR